MMAVAVQDPRPPTGLADAAPGCQSLLQRTVLIRTAPRMLTRSLRVSLVFGLSQDVSGIPVSRGCQSAQLTEVLLLCR